MMMLAITMVKGITVNTKSKHDHACFKRFVVDDIDPEKGQAAKE